MRIKTTTIGDTPVFLANTHFEAISLTIKMASAERVIAGTPVAMDGTIISDANAADAIGITLNDATAGQPSVAVIVHGMIDEPKLPAPIPDAAKAAMKGIIFLYKEGA